MCKVDVFKDRSFFVFLWILFLQLFTGCPVSARYCFEKVIFLRQSFPLILYKNLSCKLGKEGGIGPYSRSGMETAHQDRSVIRITAIWLDMFHYFFYFYFPSFTSPSTEVFACKALRNLIFQSLLWISVDRDIWGIWKDWRLCFVLP